jgi:hypothetical protein
MVQLTILHMYWCCKHIKISQFIIIGAHRWASITLIVLIRCFYIISEEIDAANSLLQVAYSIKTFIINSAVPGGYQEMSSIFADQ